MEPLQELSREELIQIIIELRRRNERLQAEVEQLKRGRWCSSILQREAETGPKPPGRKPGQGPFRFRAAPDPAAASAATVVPVAEPCCPNCGGELGDTRRENVSTTDIAEQPRPEVRRYSVEVRGCRRCGGKVRGQHPGVAAGQHGATAHRIGPRVKALAHILHYMHGVPARRTPAILEDLTGVRLTQSAITQDAMNQSEAAVGARYQALRASVQEQPVVHTDDTGWRVGGQTAFLMAFVHASLSVYQVRRRHRNEEVRELIPADFAGVLVCDRGRSYNAVELEHVAQPKCLAHLIRNAADLAKHKTGRARCFSMQLADTLQRALSLAAGEQKVATAYYWNRAVALDNELTVLLRDRTLRDADNQRLLNGAGEQHDRGRLLRFAVRSLHPADTFTRLVEEVFDRLLRHVAASPGDFEIVAFPVSGSSVRR